MVTTRKVNQVLFKVEHITGEDKIVQKRFWRNDSLSVEAFHVRYSWNKNLMSDETCQACSQKLLIKKKAFLSSFHQTISWNCCYCYVYKLTDFLQQILNILTYINKIIKPRFEILNIKNELWPCLLPTISNFKDIWRMQMTQMRWRNDFLFYFLGPAAVTGKWNAK